MRFQRPEIEEDDPDFASWFHEEDEEEELEGRLNSSSVSEGISYSQLEINQSKASKKKISKAKSSINVLVAPTIKEISAGNNFELKLPYPNHEPSKQLKGKLKHMVSRSMGLPSNSISFTESNKQLEELKHQSVSIIKSEKKQSKQMKFFKTDDHQQERISATKSAIHKTCDINFDEVPKVLLVDDTVFNLMILQNIFLLNFKVKTEQAISGEEALEKCKQRIKNGQEAYHFIVMDINMPGMDGVVTTKKIREIFDPYVRDR